MWSACRVVDLMICLYCLGRNKAISNLLFDVVAVYIVYLTSYPHLFLSRKVFIHTITLVTMVINVYIYFIKSSVYNDMLNLLLNKAHCYSTYPKEIFLGILFTCEAEKIINNLLVTK